MIRSFYVMLCFLFLCKGSNSQAGASIVYDPTNGAQIASLLGTIKELKEGADEWKANTEFLQKIMKQAPEVKRLITMLEGIFCATDEMEILLELNGGIEACGEKLELDITLMNIEGVSEKLNWIAVGGVMLTQYETVQTLKDLNDQLESAVRYVNRMNNFLKGNVLNNLLREYDSKFGGSNLSSLTQMNL